MTHPLSSFAQQPISDSITLPLASLDINTPQEGTLDNIIKKNYINDTEEINYKNFNDNILRDIREDIEDMINRKIKLIEKTSKASKESCSLNYLEQINNLKRELVSKNLIINKLLETVNKFTNSHLYILKSNQYLNTTLKTLVRAAMMLKIILQSVL